MVSQDRSRLISFWPTTSQHSILEKSTLTSHPIFGTWLVEAGIVDELFETADGEAYDMVGAR